MIILKFVAVGVAGLLGFWVGKGTPIPMPAVEASGVESGGAEVATILPDTRNARVAHKELYEDTLLIPFIYVRYLSMGSLDDDLRASDDWAALLRLSEAERTEFDRLGKEFVKGFSTAELDNAVVEDEGESVLVRIAPFPEEGSRLRTQYARGMQALLGYERVRLMTAVLGHALESEFGDFGKRRLHVTITQRPDQDKVSFGFTSYDTVDKLPEPLRANHTEDMLLRRRSGQSWKADDIPMRFERMLDLAIGSQ